jgi:putative acetyltransferase
VDRAAGSALRAIQPNRRAPLEFTVHGLPARILDTASLPVIELTSPAGHELEDVRAILREYADGVGVDLCFQNFEQELAGLPGEYAPPRGALVLARVDGEAAGCCALRPMDSVDYPNAAEMKRLYVRKAFRGFGLGRRLAEAVLDAARQAGYACVLLDTLDDMEAARALYEDLGFEEVPPYYHNPIAGAHYLKAQL